MNNKMKVLVKELVILVLDQSGQQSNYVVCQLLSGQIMNNLTAEECLGIPGASIIED